MASPYGSSTGPDGTLTKPDKGGHTADEGGTEGRRRALRKKVVLASGRPTQGVMPLAKELRLDEYSGYILSFNGGRIINCKTGETVFARSLPVSANKKIIGLAEDIRWTSSHMRAAGSFPQIRSPRTESWRAGSTGWSSGSRRT